SRQHDPTGLLVFDEKLRQYRPPTSRAGGLTGLLHAIDAVAVGGATNLEASFQGMGEHLSRRGLVAVISDFYCDAEALLRAVQPLAIHGHDIMLVQILDPQEIKPQWRDATMIQDSETQERINVSGVYWREQYPQRLAAHLAALKKAAANAGAHYIQVSTDEPLDRALRRYLLFREGRN
ncbi:MAG: VWA domain-containing protein, partial [Candidatus Obscuribacterales bacterium]|nr:VWA domain-containing protein [Steroidobacteraceae bacterium]